MGDSTKTSISQPLFSHENEGDALVVLLNVTRELGEDRSLEDSLRIVTDAAIALLPGDHASIRLLDASRAELLSGARSGAGSDQDPLAFKRGDGVMGWVVENREGVLLDQAEHDPRYKAVLRQGFAVRSLIVEPLWSAGHVIGVLCVSSGSEGAFSNRDQLLTRLLANCSAPPVERSRLSRLAMTDDLTLAFNKRYMTPRLEEEVARAKRTRSSMSLLLMDLDHFKSVNDEHGHFAGDAVLRLFADHVRATVRRIDVFIRRGGEEFVLLMPGTREEQALATAERIREKLESTPFCIEGGLSILQTVSIGVATSMGNESIEALQERADAAMYTAKRRGRNAVVLAPPPVA